MLHSRAVPKTTFLHTPKWRLSCPMDNPSPPKPPAAARISGLRETAKRKVTPNPTGKAEKPLETGPCGRIGRRVSRGVLRHFRVTLCPRIRGPGLPTLACLARSDHRPDLLVRQAGAGDHGFAGAGGFGVELFLVDSGGAVIVDHALAVDPYGVDASAVG